MCSMSFTYYFQEVAPLPLTIFPFGCLTGFGSSKVERTIMDYFIFCTFVLLVCASYRGRFFYFTHLLFPPFVFSCVAASICLSAWLLLAFDSIQDSNFSRSKNIFFPFGLENGKMPLDVILYT